MANAPVPPNGPCHRRAQAAELRRIILQPWKTRLIEKIHVLELDGQLRACGIHRAPATFRGWQRLKPTRVLRRAAIKQGHLPPILRPRVERAPKVHGIDPETI
jgi:hypothetical protein